MRRKCFYVLMTVVLLISLCACGSNSVTTNSVTTNSVTKSSKSETVSSISETNVSSGESEKTDSSINEDTSIDSLKDSGTESQDVVEADPKVDRIDFTSSEGNIKYVGYEKTKVGLTQNDKTTLIFIFDYTNKKEEPNYVFRTYNVMFYQNGKELNTSVTWTTYYGDPELSEQTAYLEGSSSLVQKDGTVRFGSLVEIKDESPVTIQINPIASNERSKYQMMEVDIQEETDDEGFLDATYKNIGILMNENVVYKLKANGTFVKKADITGLCCKGIVQTNSNGFTLKENKSSHRETFKKCNGYFYNTDGGIPYFDEDEEYGRSISLDSDGRTDQSFETYYINLSGGLGVGVQYVIGIVFNEDGSFKLYSYHYDLSNYSTTGQFSVSNKKNYTGTYSVNDNIITLNYDGTDHILIIDNDKIYFDVIQKIDSEDSSSSN